MSEPLILQCKREIDLWDNVATHAVLNVYAVPPVGDWAAQIADEVVRASRLRKIEFPKDDSPY